MFCEIYEFRYPTHCRRVWRREFDLIGRIDTSMRLLRWRLNLRFTFCGRIRLTG
jgi:hypothetical protein